MDFRSQLSAFSKGGGGGSGGRDDDRSRQGSRDDRGYHGRGGGGSGGGDYRSQSNDRRRSYDQGRHRGDSPPHQRRRHHSPNRNQDALYELRAQGYHIPHGPPPARDPQDKSVTRHIALLVICIDGLPYEHIWKAWCESAPPGTWVSLVVHAKYPERIQSEWLKERLIVYPPKNGRGDSFLDPAYLTRRPAWGSIEITRAMLDLLKNGIRVGICKAEDPRFSANRYVAHRPEPDPAEASEGKTDEDKTKGQQIPTADQFVYVSESCLPVTSAKEMFERAKDPAVSWVNARNRKDEGTPKNHYESDQFGGIHRRIPGQYRWKADQWMMLCRQHVGQLLGMDRNLPPLWHSFRSINASDEMYFPTCLAILSCLRWSDPPRTEPDAKKQNQTDTVLKRPVTYTDWTEGVRNPATFTKGASDFRKVARSARSQGCLFARKFAPFLSIPGVAAKDQVITGLLSVADWESVLDGIREGEPKEEKEDDDDEPTFITTAAKNDESAPGEQSDKESAEEGEDSEEGEAKSSDSEGECDAENGDADDDAGEEEEEDDEEEEAGDDSGDGSHGETELT